MVVEEMKMIKGILRMDVVKVREIMKPRVDLVTIEIDSEFNELADLISKSGYSKIPVIGDSIDDVKGIVYAKDTLKINLLLVTLHFKGILAQQRNYLFLMITLLDFQAQL